jgi:hypothetical protein
MEEIEKLGDSPDPSMFDNSFEAPMVHYAIKDNLPGVIQIISDKGGNMNAFHCSATVLVNAVSRSRVECVDVLLKCGADPHMPASMGYTSLFTDMEGVHVSCKRGQIALDVAYLVHDIHVRRRDDAAVARAAAIIVKLGGSCPEAPHTDAAECPVCFTPERDEWVPLPCSHQICRFCAVRIQRYDDGEPRIKCPICRADHPSSVMATVSVNRRRPLSVNTSVTTLSELVALVFPRQQASVLPISVDGGDAVLSELGVGHMSDVSVNTMIRVRNCWHY